MSLIAANHAAGLPPPPSELQLREAGGSELKHAPVVRLKSTQEGRTVAIRYWVVRDAAQRTPDATRVIQPMPWAKAYIGARDIIQAIQDDDQNLSCDFATALFLFVGDESDCPLDAIPEFSASDIFSLQTGVTLFSIQVVPLVTVCTPQVSRMYFQLALDGRTSSRFVFSGLRPSHGCVRYWDSELQGYTRAGENTAVVPTGGLSVSILVEQKLIPSSTGLELVAAKQPPRESYASIFSRLVDHHQLAAVPHVATEHPDWQAASRALQLGFLNARSGHTDKALRALLWNGVPHRYRRGFWLAMSGSLTTLRANPRTYDAALARVLAHKERYSSDNSSSPHQQLAPNMRKVPLFGAELDPHTEALRNVAYGVLNKEGQRQLKVLLCVLQETHATLFYAPGVVVLLCILLLFLSAEEAYATVACLLHVSSLGGLPWFFRSTVTEHELLVSWFSGVLAARHAALHNHLQQLEFRLAPLLMSWFTTFFSEHLPLHAALQVVDVFLMEGATVLYKVALAALGLLETDLLACTTAKEVAAVFEDRMPALPAGDLLLRAFRTPITRKDIPFAEKDVEFDFRRPDHAPVLYDPSRDSQEPDFSPNRRHFLNPLKGRGESPSGPVNQLPPLPAIGTGAPAPEHHEPGLMLSAPEQRGPRPSSKIEIIDDDVQIEAVDEGFAQNSADPTSDPSSGRLLEWPGMPVDKATRGRGVERPVLRRTRSLGLAQRPPVAAPQLPNVTEVNALLGLTAGPVAAVTDWRLDLPASSPYLYGLQHSDSSPDRTTALVPAQHTDTSPTQGTLIPRRGSLADRPLVDHHHVLTPVPLAERGFNHPKSLLKPAQPLFPGMSSPIPSPVASIRSAPVAMLEGPADPHTTSPTIVSASPKMNLTGVTSPPSAIATIKRPPSKKPGGSPH